MRNSKNRLCCLANCSLAGAVAFLAFGVAPVATAQTCLQDEFKAAGNNQSLGCTANDVRVAQVVNVRDPVTNKPLTTCFQGSLFNFLADFEIVTSSTSSRSNIGLYFASQGQATALTGTCVDNIISPPHPNAAGITLGSDNYHELDGAPDNCGDTSSSDNSSVFGAAAEGVTVEVDNFLCEAPAGSATLQLPNCTSWQVPGKTITCTSPAPNYPYEVAAIPGSPSKCNCGTLALPITPVTASAIVQKACTTTLTTGPATFTQNPQAQSPTLCDAGPEGSTVTYTVAITNTSTVGGLDIDQICDSAYGTIYDNGKFSACPAGTSGIAASNVSCPPAAIAQGATGTCTFTAKVGENLAGLLDTVTASGHSAVNTSSTFSKGSNSVSVTSSDAPSTATITKGVTATEAACATVRYNVDVANTSGADENLTVNTLSDSAYGDVTKLGASILGTTCGVATTSPGLGTLSGSSGAGVLPASLLVGGADYKCQFDAQFCSGLDPNSCISNTDRVSGTFSGDEAADKVTLTDNQITVKECLTTTVTSGP